MKILAILALVFAGLEASTITLKGNGYVRDPNGNPVPGVRVRIARFYQANELFNPKYDPMRWVIGISTTTDSGFYEFTVTLRSVSTFIVIPWPENEYTFVPTSYTLDSTKINEGLVFVRYKNKRPVVEIDRPIGERIFACSTHTLTCFAFDMDNDELFYSWYIETGTILANKGREVTWLAPDKPGSFIISVSVTDQKGGLASTNNVNFNILGPKEIYDVLDNAKIVADPWVVPVGGTTTVKLIAPEIEGTRVIIYSKEYRWFTPFHSIIQGRSEPVAVWFLPQSTGTYQINCSIQLKTNFPPDAFSYYRVVSASVTVKSSSCPNLPPVIENIKANPTTLFPYGISNLTCIAQDPEGESLKYVWNAVGGTISGFGRDATWIAPLKAGKYLITCTVFDIQGGSATASIELTVIVKNNPPKIHSITTNNPVVIRGGSLVVECIAVDPDGDPLTYSWTASGGIISGFGPRVSWVAPLRASTYKIKVIVSDPYSEDSGEISIVVNSCWQEGGPPIQDLTVSQSPVKDQKFSFGFACSYNNPSFEIEVFDISGDLVKVITDPPVRKTSLGFGAPVYDVGLESSGLSKGVYIFKIKAKEGDKVFEKTKKLTILK